MGLCELWQRDGAGLSIWATNFEDTGLVDAGPGPISLTATAAVLSNGVFNASFNDIVLSSGSLFISNQVLNAGHNLTIGPLIP